MFSSFSLFLFSFFVFFCFLHFLFSFFDFVFSFFFALFFLLFSYFTISLMRPALCVAQTSRFSIKVSLTVERFEFFYDQRNSLLLFYCNINKVFSKRFLYRESRFLTINVYDSFRTCRCGPIVLSNLFDLVYCSTFYLVLRRYAFIGQTDGRSEFYNSVF